MKKIVCFLLSAAMLFLLAITASAEGITLSEITVQGDDRVYITLSFDQGVKGNSVGITYSYDAKQLAPVPEESSWVQKGLLTDFGTTTDDAVWASVNAKDLEGPFCVLAFRILNPKSFRKSDVQCTAIVKNGSDVAGEFNTSATVRKECDHNYGAWNPDNTLGHVRTCEKCGERQLQSHTMGQATTQQDPQDPAKILRKSTCTVCGWEKTESLPGGAVEVQPTLPVATDATEPTRDYRPPVTQPTYPTRPTEPYSGGQQPTEGHDHSQQAPTTSSEGPNDYNHVENTPEGDDGHNHAENTPDGDDGHNHGSDAPMVIPVEEGAPSLEELEALQAAAAGETGNSATGAMIIVVTVAALAAAGYWVYRKKK